MRIGAALVAGASLYGGSATLDGNAAVGSNTLNAATFGFAARHSAADQPHVHAHRGAAPFVLRVVWSTT